MSALSPSPEPTAPGFTHMRFHGDGLLLLYFGSEINDAVNERVLAFDAALRDSPPLGVVETVPSYASLGVHYDPVVVELSDLVDALRAIVPRPRAAQAGLVTVPACYDPDVATDLVEFASLHGRTPESVAAEHAATEFRVYLIGYAPGWVYLGGLPPTLHTPRRAVPSLSVPAGSLMIGGRQAMIANLPMPSGWYVIGRTPLSPFDPAAVPPSRFEPGQRIRFAPVARAEYESLLRGPGGFGGRM